MIHSSCLSEDTWDVGYCIWGNFNQVVVWSKHFSPSSRGCFIVLYHVHKGRNNGLLRLPAWQNTFLSGFGSCCRKYQCNTKHNCGKMHRLPLLSRVKKLRETFILQLLCSEVHELDFTAFYCMHYCLHHLFYLFVWSSEANVELYMTHFVHSKTLYFFFILQPNDLILSFHSMETRISSFESLIPCMNNQFHFPCNYSFYSRTKM